MQKTDSPGDPKFTQPDGRFRGLVVEWLPEGRKSGIGPTSHTTDMLYSAAIISVIAGVVSGAPSASPVLSAVSDTARFSWEIPQGGLGPGSSFYTVSPAGNTSVFIVTSTGIFLPTGSYTDRLVYQGDIAARNVTFTLSNIQTSDAGTYTCGNGGSATVIQNCGQKLVVLGKPTTPGFTVSTTPVYNQQVTLTCSSISTTVPTDHGLTLTYTWQRDNATITVTSPGSSYIFTVSSRDSHSYRCRARESQGLESEWSQGYNMEPQYGPYQISLTPSTSSYTVTEHQALPSITCSVLCRPGCSYRWLHNGTAFSNGAMLQGQADRSKTGSCRCQPSNTHGSSDSVTVSVDFQYLANVSMFTANSGSGSMTVNESDPVTLRCQIDSNPRSVIRLLNGTEELTRADNSLTAEYRLESADCRQRGNYSCTATNNIGAPVSQWVELLVKCSPRLDETLPQQLKYASRLGGNVDLSVSVLAYPLPTFTWSRTTSTNQDLTGSSSPVSDISVTARLHLTNLQQQDFGDYRLTVDNSEGRSVAYTLSIVSEGPPSTPTNVSVYPEGPFSLRVSWKEEFNGGATQTFTVEYSTDEEDWKTAESHEETGRGNYLTSVIRDLSSCTVYYVRVVASNKFGNSSYTEHVTGLTEKRVEQIRTGIQVNQTEQTHFEGVNPYSGLQDRVDDKQTYTELKKYENTGFIHSKDSANTYEELNRTSGQPYEQVKLDTYVNADYTSKGMIKVETIILHM
ncbi:contactin-5-like [Haliotis cracherodii]|uniref:contactin-5-like n=1 Tax=Haliotis cracherodii TaxID=6455 RepID=UPI0039E9401C